MECGAVLKNTDILKGAKLYLLAFFRIDLNVVCEMSKDKGHYDFHDYPDDIYGEPWHFYLMTCKRCGKRFYL